MSTFAEFGSRRPSLSGAKNSEWEKRRAARTAAHHALDAADLTLLLEMAGLSAADGKTGRRAA